MSGPTWYERAHAEMGVAEVDGGESNPRIMEYFAAAHGEWVKDDATPWCAAFVAWCLEGHDLPAEPLRARAWASFGDRLDEPTPGCVVVLRRGKDPAAGHVGFFVQWAKDKDWMYILGGNQGNRVSIQRFATDDVIAWRWPSKARVLKPAEIANGSRQAAEARDLMKVGGGTTAIGAGSLTIPPPPTEAMGQLTAWQGFAGQAHDFLAFVSQHWMLVGGLAILITGARLLAYRLEDAKTGKTWQF
jgi:uncharacterized protein (TIGR02594 family)